MVFDTIKFRQFRTFLPIIFRGNGSTIPEDCSWTIDNLLNNNDFSAQLNNWDVWIDENDFDNYDLYDSSHYDPGNSAPAAFLGGENDDSVGGDLIDQYIAQQVQLPNNTKAIAIEYSYCLETEETTQLYKFDDFFVDVQQPLGGSSILPETMHYTNLDATTGCLHDSGNWQRLSLGVNNAAPYANELITLVFYSEVDSIKVSTFYFDVVKIKVCTE